MMTWVTDYKLGDVVMDGLTGKPARVEGVSIKVGNCGPGERYSGIVVGYWLDNDWLGGGRHPWEISSMPDPTIPQDPASGGTESVG